MTDQLFINDRVKSVEHQKDGFVVGKFRSKARPSEIFYAVEYDFDADNWIMCIHRGDDLIKLPDLPDPPPVKAKVY
jgi:hypothetical protein